jgi:hypothetical protein
MGFAFPCSSRKNTALAVPDGFNNNNSNGKRKREFDLQLVAEVVSYCIEVKTTSVAKKKKRLAAVLQEIIREREWSPKQ